MRCVNPPGPQPGLQRAHFAPNRTKHSWQTIRLRIGAHRVIRAAAFVPVSAAELAVEVRVCVGSTLPVIVQPSQIAFIKLSRHGPRRSPRRLSELGARLQRQHAHSTPWPRQARRCVRAEERPELDLIYLIAHRVVYFPIWPNYSCRRSVRPKLIVLEVASCAMSPWLPVLARP